MSLSEVATQLAGAEWLVSSNIYRINFLTGTLPVDFNYPDSIFELNILPSSSAKCPFLICLRFADDISKEQFEMALHGDCVDSRVKSSKLNQIGFFANYIEMRMP